MQEKTSSNFKSAPGTFKNKGDLSVVSVIDVSTLLYASDHEGQYGTETQSLASIEKAKDNNFCQESYGQLRSRMTRSYTRLLSTNVKVKIYKIIILPVVLYGCETWSLMLREEHRLWVFDNRVLRRTFGPKRDEVTGEWRKLHNEELHNLYLSPDIIRQVKEDEVGRACGTHGREEKIVQGFGGKARRKETTGKTKA
jgi:hypothetical protein